MGQTKPLRAVKKETKQDHPVSLWDSKFIYYNASQTDVTRTWKRFGWVPVERKSA
jgi:hypothetical protein